MVPAGAVFSIKCPAQQKASLVPPFLWNVQKFTSSEENIFAVLLVFLWEMPVMNGYEAAKAIPRDRRKARARTAEAIDARADLGEIPIVALTADAFADDVARARAAA